MVNSKINSFNLSKKAIAVATISGTIAYEMALLNKSAIIFSNVFFSNLPLIHKYKSYLELKKYVYSLVNQKPQKNLININNFNKNKKFIENIHANSIPSSWNGYYGNISNEVLDDFKLLLTLTKF